MTDKRIFKLTKLNPVGFKVVNYPVPHCPLCRGYLNDVCSVCLDKKIEECNVVKHDNVHYHAHCYSFMNEKPKVEKAVEYSSEED
jgi:hypothetical protein